MPTAQTPTSSSMSITFASGETDPKEVAKKGKKKVKGKKKKKKGGEENDQDEES